MPEKIVNTIDQLHLKEVESDVIDYLSGVLQGDCMTVVIFILCLNPLSFLLKKLAGYIPGPPGRRN